VTYRIVTTPLGAPAMPERREGGVRPELLPAFVPAPGAEATLARLAEPGVLVVTTGQQPALFTGPMYTVHKAVAAAALARVLERRWGRAVVPVFWSAGDDHDYSEASSTAWLDAEGRLRTGALPPRAPDAPLEPMYRLPLGPEADELVARFGADVAGAEYAGWTTEWLARHWRAGATMGAAAAGAVAELLAPLGVACFDPTHPAAKAASAPVLLDALARSAELDADLAGRAAQLAAARAPDPGVAVGDGATLVMLEGGLGRDRLVRDGDGRFRTRRGNERFDLPALERIGRGEPSRLSANVLLRPVLESALLPTVAYVAGPGELRYLQLPTPVYARLGVPRQLPVPRWSGLVLERRVERVLEKFGVPLDEALTDLDRLERRVVREHLPPEAVAGLAALRQALDDGYARVLAGAGEVDPTLERAVEGARRRAGYGVDSVERRLVRNLRRRLDVELAQVQRVRDALRPEGAPQERMLTEATFLARHGPALLERLVEAAQTWYERALQGAPADS
jgi:bacillithiol biosynthesis cysteine-adding enzyme BshC